MNKVKQNTYNFTTTGTLIYDPSRGKMKTNTSGWCVVNTHYDICRYYRWWVWRKYGIVLHEPSWGAHVSVIRGYKLPKNKQHLWKKYHGETIKFMYSHNVRRTGDTTNNDRPDNYWFVDVYSDRLTEIRNELGLMTYNKYHMTIGRTN